MKKKTALVVLFFALAPFLIAEKKYKPWTEWSSKDAQKILDDSPWGQVQVETDTSEMFYSPGRSESRDRQGALNQATTLNLRIRWLTAKPVRQAFARLQLLAQPKADPQFEARMKAFVDRKDLDPFIVITVDYDSKDGRMSGPAMQLLSSANTSLLRNNTYLETKNGKRNFLRDYNPPDKMGLGAKFIFMKELDGEPFITANSGEVRFYCELGDLQQAQQTPQPQMTPGIGIGTPAGNPTAPFQAKNLKMNMRFKVADFMYDGKLEF